MASRQKYHRASKSETSPPVPRKKAKSAAKVDKEVQQTTENNPSTSTQRPKVKKSKKTVPVAAVVDDDHATPRSDTETKTLGVKRGRPRKVKTDASSTVVGRADRAVEHMPTNSQAERSLKEKLYKILKRSEEKELAILRYTIILPVHFNVIPSY